MSLEIKVPSVGESITTVTVASWSKSDGDIVEMDEVICELESDKATFEVTAEVAGQLKIVAQEGDSLEIGEILCRIDESTSGNGSSTDSKSNVATDKVSLTDDGPKPTGEIKEMVVPTVGESITEVVLSTWLKSDGDFVEMDENIAEIESDKATFDLTAEAPGKLKIEADEGATLEIGDLICKIEVMEGTPASSAENQPEKATGNSTSNSGKDTYATGHASPAAAKILKEKGIHPEDVMGTGKDGRITKEDAEKADKRTKSKEKAPEKDEGQKKPTMPAYEQPEFKAIGAREERREKMTSLRKTIARRLVGVKNDTAMLTTFNEVNMGPIMELRKKYKELFKEKYEVGLGFMSFFTKACCVALQEWPAVNARIDEDEIVYNKFCDVSIAVSTERGLVVPVIRNAESLAFDQIEKEIIRLAIKARDGKLSIPEMEGGTFTITNGGIFGSMMSTPIINSPQSAILGMHNIVERPMAVHGEVKILPMMYLALSYDHRIVDGRESVSFLVRIKELLEDPTRLLIGV